jgi:hypothetical protein
VCWYELQEEGERQRMRFGPMVERENADSREQEWRVDESAFWLIVRWSKIKRGLIYLRLYTEFGTSMNEESVKV